VKNNKAGIELIKVFEGFSTKPYLCAAGYLTIGYGHKVLKTEDFIEITKEQAEEILIKDLRLAESSVARLIIVPITENMFSALVSFVFNLGQGALQGSTLRRMINRRDYIHAAYEFPKWIYAAGVKLPGLLRRRYAEQLLFLSGGMNEETY
jgi:lysozyme